MVTIHHRYLQCLAIELYKSKNGYAIDTMKGIFVDKNYNGPILRSQTDFEIPQVNSVHKGDDSLRYFGPLMWNIIPKKFKNEPSLKAFKEQIKKWRPNNCPCRLCKEYIQGVGYVNAT